MTLKITIPVTEEWNHMFMASPFYPYVRRSFQRRLGHDDFVNHSDVYSKACGEPVWFYSCGNSRWLRCPMGIPGDILNDHGDQITEVMVVQVNGTWMFVIYVEEAK